MIENLSVSEKTIGLTSIAASFLQKELQKRKNQGFSASKTGLASEAIIKAYGKQLGSEDV